MIYYVSYQSPYRKTKRMITPTELYKTLSADFKAERKFYFADRGEGMIQAREKGSNRVFLVNNKTKEAWELLTANGRFSFWDASAVEIASTFSLPYKSQRNAVEQRAPYYFGINEFKGGVASVSWTLQPDGRYYADEDGFGMTDDAEINFYAFIDPKANVLVPFQPMDDQLKAQYRKQAIIIAKNSDDVPYVCLSPEMTIPAAENKNLEAHKEKLQRIIYGMMYQFASQARNAYKHPEYEGRLGIFSAINPDTKHYLSLTIYGNMADDNKGSYEIYIVTALYKQGEEPQGCSTPMGTFDIEQIDEIMSIEDNVPLICDDFLESVNMIYSGKLPKH